MFLLKVCMNRHDCIGSKWSKHMYIALVYGRYPAIVRSCVAKQSSASGILTHPHCFFRECIAIQKEPSVSPSPSFSGPKLGDMHSAEDRSVYYRT
jgi:hypothetical protein